MLLNCGVREDSWESLGLQGDPTSPSWRRSVLGVHWKDWCWSWNSSTLATSCKELTHWKRPWCWEGFGAGGEGDGTGWDGWMASSTRWIWVWVNSGSLWWTGRPGMLRFMGSERIRHDWATELKCLLHTEHSAFPSSTHYLIYSSQYPRKRYYNVYFAIQGSQIERTPRSQSCKSSFGIHIQICLSCSSYCRTQPPLRWCEGGMEWEFGVSRCKQWSKEQVATITGNCI